MTHVRLSIRLPDANHVRVARALRSGCKASASVIYRSKMHPGRVRNFQVMSGAPWLALLCRHIPERGEHLVRCVG